MRRAVGNVSQVEWWTDIVWPFIAGVGLWIGAAAVFIGSLWTEAIWPWVSGWMYSPGFGGAAAVTAAAIAFLAARRKMRMDAWWQRAEWALNLYVSRESTSYEREVGAAALLELQRSA